MKTITIAVILVSMGFLTPAFAQDNQPRKGPGPDFESRKTQILQRIDERLKGLQDKKDCIQAARSHDDLKSCMEKFGNKRR